jgi:hypothetical protein
MVRHLSAKQIFIGSIPISPSTFVMTKCLLHPKYKAVFPPRTFCNPCWAMYKEKHELEKTLKAYYSFVGRLAQEGGVNPKKLKELQKIME